jgi:hypothetical protein
MVSYFSDIVKDLKDRTQVATSVLLDGEETAEVRHTPLLMLVLVCPSVESKRIHDRLWCSSQNKLVSIDASVEKAMLDGLGPHLILRISFENQQLVSLGRSPTDDSTLILFLSVSFVERRSNCSRQGIPSNEIPNAKVNRSEYGHVYFVEVCLCWTGR